MYVDVNLTSPPEILSIVIVVIITYKFVSTNIIMLNVLDYHVSQSIDTSATRFVYMSVAMFCQSQLALLTVTVL